MLLWLVRRHLLAWRKHGHVRLISVWDMAIPRIHDSELLRRALHLGLSQVTHRIDCDIPGGFNSDIRSHLLYWSLIINIHENFRFKDGLHSLIQSLVIQGLLVRKLLGVCRINTVNHNFRQLIHSCLSDVAWQVGEVRIWMCVLNLHVLILK